MSRHKRNSWQDAAIYILTFVGVLWAVEVFNAAVGHRLNLFGIYPREINGLWGLVFWPFLHGSIQHLVVNTAPFVVLGWFVALRGPAIFLQTTILITLLAGVGVWIFGREAYHIGASGLVFGYFGFLVARGIYEKSISALAIASFTLFYYGGMIFGILPGDEFISWEAHLFGLIAGIFAAKYLPVTAGPGTTGGGS